MSFETVNGFSKTKHCHPTVKLLSFSLATLPDESASEMISHLEVSDFCGAEAHFPSNVKARKLQFLPARRYLRTFAYRVTAQQTDEGSAADPLAVLI